MQTDFKTSIAQAAAALRSSGAKAVYLFGSATKQRLREDSDIDLAVSGLPPERFFRALSVASRYLDRPLHLVDLDEATPFVRHLKEEGELERIA